MIASTPSAAAACVVAMAITSAGPNPSSVTLAARIAERQIFVCPTINANAPYIAALTGIKVGEQAQGLRETGVRLIAGTDAGIDNNPHHQYLGGLEYLVTLGFPPADVLAMATTEAAAALGVDAITGRLEAGYEADVIVVDGDPRADIAALGRLRRVIARGRDYLPDSGRFDVSAPGTPFASLDHRVDLRLLEEATRRRLTVKPGGTRRR